MTESIDYLISLDAMSSDYLHDISTANSEEAIEKIENIQSILNNIQQDFTLLQENEFIFSNEFNMAPLSSWALTIDDDNSEKVLYSRLSQSMNDFVFMMRLWCQQTEIFQQQYCELLQVLKLLKNISSISLLSLKLFTLKMNVQAQLSLLTLH